MSAVPTLEALLTFFAEQQNNRSILLFCFSCLKLGQPLIISALGGPSLRFFEKAKLGQLGQPLIIKDLQKTQVGTALNISDLSVLQFARQEKKEKSKMELRDYQEECLRAIDHKRFDLQKSLLF